MIIEEGLIAIGILALIAAIFLLRGKGKTNQPKQQVMQPAVNKQAVDLAGPSVSPKAQTAPFPVPQVPFPVSSGNRQTVDFTEQNTQSTQSTQFSFPVSQVPFPGSDNGQVAGFVEPTRAAANVPSSMPTADVQATILAQPSQVTDTLMQIDFPVQNPTVVTQTPSWEVQPRQTQVELTQPSQAQVAAALSGQHVAKPDQGLPVVQARSSTSSGGVPSSLNAVAKVLPNSPSIERQLAELMADIWALQQQAVDIGRRLNYLNTCIQQSLTSTPDESGANSKGNN